MPQIDLRSAAGSMPPIDMGQLDVGLTDGGDIAPILMVLTNRENFDLSEIRVAVDGPGARAVQLARDHDSQPGGWVNGEIIALAGVLPSNRSCQFWTRVIVDDSLELGEQDFEFVINAVAVRAE